MAKKERVRYSSAKPIPLDKEDPKVLQQIIYYSVIETMLTNLGEDKILIYNTNADRIIKKHHHCVIAGILACKEEISKGCYCV